MFFSGLGQVSRDQRTLEVKDIRPYTKLMTLKISQSKNCDSVSHKKISRHRPCLKQNYNMKG